MRLTLCVIVIVLLSLACFRSGTRLSPEHACWQNESAFDAIRREMLNTLLERPDGSSARLRRLAAVAREKDSIRAHVQVVTDGATCVRAAKEFIEVEPGDRFAVLRIGATYWVRSTRGGSIVALDEHFHTVMTFIALD